MFTTHIGFVMRTVALPATAPAIIDSIVVSFLDARELRIAARSKKARVHSYPGQTHCQLVPLRPVSEHVGVEEIVTVVIDKISNAYAKKGAVKAGVKPCYALLLDDAANSIIGG